MSLFFLHPLYLLALAATTVPLLIHLLNRRKVKRIRFPAVRFILLSQRRISRSYRLRHWILLALRTFAVLLLVLLLAHPIFQTGVGLFAGGGPLSAVILLDNSLSMKWSGGSEGFKQAKEAARLLISSLNDGDRAAVVPTNGFDKSPIRLKGEKEILARDVEAVQVSAGTADFSVALARAYELLREPAAQREIWLLTDMALTGWENFTIAALGQHDPLIPLKILRIGGKEEPLNAALKEVKMRGHGVGVGLPIHLEASVVNFGDREIKDLLVQLYIDERNREQKLISVPPKGEVGVGFTLQLGRPGEHQGYVALKKDGLAGNPISYFTLQAQDKLRVLVVDGDPQTALVQSETFFLARALNPAGERDSSLFLPTVIIPEGMGSVALDAYQVVALCNVSAVPDAFLARLREYLHKGGGLLLFLGDRVETENYNARLFDSSPPVLPARIREKRTLSEAAAEKIGEVETAHPALQLFADERLRDSLQSAKVHGYFRTDRAGGSTLLSLAGGAPLLVEKRVGPGRVLFFTTAADRDWSDLPLKTAYLPLLQSLVSYVAGGKRGAMDTGVIVGNPKTFTLPPSYVGKSLQVVKPDRKERGIIFAAAGEKASAAFQENDLAGIYRLASAAADIGGAAQMYPVNSPFLESRLEAIGEQELKRKLEPIRAEILDREALEKGGARIDLSLSLLFLLIATLASEGWLAQRF